MIVQQLVDAASQQRETLATLTYASAPSESPSTIGFVSNVTLRTGKIIEIRANYAAFNTSFTTVVIFEGKQIFWASAQWDKVTPYFAFRTPDDCYVELYFDKETPTNK